MIAAKAADRDVGEAKEAKEVEIDHAPEAETEVEERDRVEKPPAPTRLQISRNRIRK